MIKKSNMLAHAEFHGKCESEPVETKLYTCPANKCEKSYTMKSSLCRHYRNSHPGVMPDIIISLKNKPPMPKPCPGCLIPQVKLKRHQGSCIMWKRLEGEAEADKAKQVKLPSPSRRLDRATKCCKNDSQCLNDHNGATPKTNLKSIMDEAFASKISPLSESTRKSYRPALEALFCWWELNNVLTSREDLVNFSDAEYPTLLPNIQQYLDVQEMSPHMRQHTTSAYSWLCKTLSNYITSNAKLLTENWRHMGRVQVLTHLQSMRNVNAKRIKVCRKQCIQNTKQRAHNERAIGKGFHLETIQKYLATYAKSSERECQLDALIQPSKMADMCKSQSGFCLVRDILNCEFVVTTGFCRQEVYTKMTLENWLMGQEADVLVPMTDGTKKTISAKILHIGNHKTSMKGPAYVTISDKRLIALMDIYVLDVRQSIICRDLVKEQDSNKLEAPLFCTYKCKRQKNAHPERIFRKWGNIKNTERFRLHWLRHVFGAWGIAEGEPNDVMARALNHSIDVHNLYYLPSEGTEKVQRVARANLSFGLQDHQENDYKMINPNLGQLTREMKKQKNAIVESNFRKEKAEKAKRSHIKGRQRISVYHRRKLIDILPRPPNGSSRISANEWRNLLKKDYVQDLIRDISQSLDCCYTEATKVMRSSHRAYYRNMNNRLA